MHLQEGSVYTKFQKQPFLTKNPIGQIKTRKPINILQSKDSTSAREHVITTSYAA